MDPDPDPEGPKTCGSGSATLTITFCTFMISVADPESEVGGAEINLNPRTGTVIMNYAYGSGSLLFYQRFEEILIEKNHGC
jgi:hypothetical protein